MTCFLPCVRVAQPNFGSLGGFGLDLLTIIKQYLTTENSCDIMRNINAINLFEGNEVVLLTSDWIFV